MTGTGNTNLDILVDDSGLNGTIGLQLNNGFIHGVDIDYYLKQARIQLKTLQQFIGDSSLDDFSAEKTVDKKKTDFDSITATILANSNVLTNNDLRLDSNDFTAVGDGSIDLNNEFISYKFTATRKYSDNKDHSHALPLSVRVKGTFDNIKVMPDIDAYVQAVLKEELKRKAEGELSKQLWKALGGSSDGASKSVDEVIEDKLQDEINKLFKF
jgi:uncharacterized protein involved in outer membrane biogenesis